MRLDDHLAARLGPPIDGTPAEHPKPRRVAAFASEPRSQRRGLPVRWKAEATRPARELHAFHGRRCSRDGDTDFDGHREWFRRLRLGQHDGDLFGRGVPIPRRLDARYAAAVESNRRASTRSDSARHRPAGAHTCPVDSLRASRAARLRQVSASGAWLQRKHREPQVERVAIAYGTVTILVHEPAPPLDDSGGVRSFWRTRCLPIASTSTTTWPSASSTT